MLQSVFVVSRKSETDGTFPNFPLGETENVPPLTRFLSFHVLVLSRPSPVSSPLKPNDGLNGPPAGNARQSKSLSLSEHENGGQGQTEHSPVSRWLSSQNQLELATSLYFFLGVPWHLLKRLPDPHGHAELREGLIVGLGARRLSRGYSCSVPFHMRTLLR
jgi:hypothetical protein